MVSQVLMTSTISYIDQNYENSLSSMKVQEEKPVLHILPAPDSPLQLMSYKVQPAETAFGGREVKGWTMEKGYEVPTRRESQYIMFDLQYPYKYCK